MRGQISFTSRLGVEHLEELQELLFFNRQQSRVRGSIARSIEEYGMPEISSDGGLLRIGVGQVPGVQSLFALEEAAGGTRVVGAMVWARVDTGRIVLLHIGVSEDYSAAGEHADKMVVMTLLHKLRQVARTIKGVSTIEMMYGQKRVSRLHV